MRIVFLILLLTVPQFLPGQRFYSVVFDQLPRDMQMYARDDDNIGRIPISGVIELPDWTHISAVVYRNGSRYGYSRANLNYGGQTTARFSMEVKIEAEPADYFIEVYACKGADSAFLVKREDILAGDFYLISGQSNAAALQFDNWGSKYCRTLARIPDGNPATSPADTHWIQSSWSHPFTGAWGIHLQRLILENYNIPTTNINAAIPGTKISQFVERNSSNPADPNNLYGALLYRLKIANPKRVRGFFWLQGEQEALEEIPGYESHFQQLHQFWMQDYPTVETFYVLQTNVIFSPYSPQIRDYQRRTPYLYPKTDHFSTLGVPLSEDRVHYLLEGYKIMGAKIFHFLGPQIYGADPDPEVRSPDIKKVFFSSTDKKEITLVFDGGQQMEWPADSVVRGRDGRDLLVSNKDFFFLDGDAGKKAPVVQGRAEGNRVILSLAEAVNASRLTYVPIEEPENLDVMQGPYLRNSRNMCVFSFADVTIAEGLAKPELSAELQANSIRLAWQSVTGATGYTLERKRASDSRFTVLAELNVTGYEDNDVEEGVEYVYRLRAINAASESPYVEASATFLLIMGKEPVASFRMFPNPVSDVLTVDFQYPQSGSVKIFTGAGVPVAERGVYREREVKISVAHWTPGLYLLVFEDEKGLRQVRKFVR